MIVQLFECPRGTGKQQKQLSFKETTTTTKTALNQSNATRIVLIFISLSFALVFRVALASQTDHQDDYQKVPQTNSNAEQPLPQATPPLNQAQIEKQAFVMELLKILHEQYGRHQTESVADDNSMQARRSGGGGAAAHPTISYSSRQMMPQLLEAISAEGDVRRLIDWVKNSFNLASIPELATQFVVSKLGSVNCAALLSPDSEESLVPRFLLFNEHFVDVPFELPLNPTATECVRNGKFDPSRQTIILIHGYLGGYTLIDGLTNMKNRLLDMNRFASEKAIETFIRASQSPKNSSYVFTEDLNMKIRSQLYNVIVIDWFNGANPTPRANYIKAAVNAQVVGKLIARFISSLINQCGTPASQVQIIGHSLGCHVAGFTGKALRTAGHRLAKITHLDPVGLCFGRLFSQPRFRLSPDDALDTQAVHVSLNIFDNPLDGAHSNVLVNGGRDQPGCGNQNEIQNSTTSSVSLLFDPAARFSPCSHLRALNLLEDDHRSESGQCQFVAYRCTNYDRFLAGKCATCDATNSQCRLMGLAPLSLQFRKMFMATPPPPPTLFHYDAGHFDESNHVGVAAAHYLDEEDDYIGAAHVWQDDLHSESSSDSKLSQFSSPPPINKTRQASNSTTQPKTAGRLDAVQLSTSTSAPPARKATTMFGQPAYFVGGNEIRRRSERRLAGEKRERISQALEKLRKDTRFALTSLRADKRPADNDDADGITSPLSPLEDNIDDQHNSLPTADESSTLGESSGDKSSLPVTTTVSLDDMLTAPMSKPQQANKLDAQKRKPDDAEHRFAGDSDVSGEQTPVGSQPIPAGSLNAPLFFVGTSSLTPYCVNYYQFRVLIAESRLQRALSQNGLASNRLKAQYSGQTGSLSGLGGGGGSLIAAAAASSNLFGASGSSGRDMLHLTVKLTDSFGHFFKGFSVLESARSLARVMNDFVGPPLVSSSGGKQQAAAVGINEPMVEITMLLNSTQAQPTKVSETILSYYFHPIVLADRLEVNYMSNISPEIRAQFSSVLCPAAINDRHQLVKYIECHKVSKRRRRRRRRK